MLNTLNNRANEYLVKVLHNVQSLPERMKAEYIDALLANNLCVLVCGRLSAERIQAMTRRRE